MFAFGPHGASPGLPGQKDELGPVLDPEGKLPTLDDSPFAPPTPKSGQIGPTKPLDAPTLLPSCPTKILCRELNNPINPPALRRKAQRTSRQTHRRRAPERNPFVPVAERPSVSSFVPPNPPQKGFSFIFSPARVMVFVT